MAVIKPSGSFPRDSSATLGMTGNKMRGITGNKMFRMTPFCSFVMLSKRSAVETSRGRVVLVATPLNPRGEKLKQQ